MTRVLTWRALSAALAASLLFACGDDGGGAAVTETTGDEGSTSTATTMTVTTATATTTSAETSEGPSTSSGVGDATSTDGPTSSSSQGESGSSETGDPVQAVTISFAATVNGEPFACGQTYDDAGNPGNTVEPLDLRFFVQDVWLVRADDDTEVPVTLDVLAPWQAETVALVDFEDATGACVDGNPQVRTEVSGVVPPGEYDGLVFTVGVPQDLNHGDPLFAPPPLNAGAMTWGWLYGYKFMKVELQQVVDEGEAGIGLLHLGSNDCSGMPAIEDVTCSLPNRSEIRLDAFDPGSDTVVLDVGALFAETDMGQVSMCHSAGAPCPSLFDRIGVDLDTGLPSPTQSVFAVQ